MTERPVRLNPETIRAVHGRSWMIWKREESDPDAESAQRIIDIFGKNYGQPIEVPISRYEDMEYISKILRSLLPNLTSIEARFWNNNKSSDKTTEEKEFIKRNNDLRDSYLELAIELETDESHSPGDWLELGMHSLLSESQLREFGHSRHAQSSNLREKHLHWLANCFLQKIRTEKKEKK